MMLKTSCRKINPGVNMYFVTLRRMLPIIIISTVAFLLVCPAFFMVNADLFVDELSKEMDGYYLHSDSFIWLFNNVKFDINQMNITLTSIACVFAAIAPVIVCTINFSFLFSKKSSDFYLALPLKRTEMFISRSLASVTATVIPIVLSFTAMSVLSVVLPHTGSGLPDVLWSLAYVITVLLLSTVISLLFLACAGAVGDFIISLLGVNFGALAVAGIVGFLLSNSLYGYTFDENAYELFNLLSPPFYCVFGVVEHFSEHSDMSVAAYFIRNGIIIVALYFASLLLFKRRKTEKGGQGYAYSFMYVLCSLIASFCIAFVVGIFFGLFEINIAFFLFGIVGSIGAAILFGAISFRGFKTIKKSLILGGIAAVIPIIIYVIGITGGLGYTRYVPQADDIKSVTVVDNAMQIACDDMSLVTDLHKAIVKNRFSEFNETNTDENNIFVDFVFIYKLKNGNTVRRTYSAMPKAFEKEYKAVTLSDYQFDTMLKKSKRAKGLRIEYYNAYETKEEMERNTCYYLPTEKLEGLIEIFKVEARKAKITNNYHYINFELLDYESETPTNYNGRLYYFDNGYYDFALEALKDCPKSVEYLEQNGEAFDENAYMNEQPEEF